MILNASAYPNHDIAGMDNNQWPQWKLALVECDGQGLRNMGFKAVEGTDNEYVRKQGQLAMYVTLPAKPWQQVVAMWRYIVNTTVRPFGCPIDAEIGHAILGGRGNSDILCENTR